MRRQPFFGSILELVDKKVRPRPHGPPARSPSRREYPRPKPVPAFSLPPGWGLGDLATVTVIYLSATLFLTLPLALNPATSGPFGRPEALENAWVLSWVGRQLVTNPLALFDAGTFHPLPHTLAFSEHLFVPGLIALPFLAITNDLVLTSNIVLLIAVLSSAIGMYLLTVNLTGNPLAAILAGLFYSFIPYRFAHLYLLQLQFYAFLPLALACLHLFLQTGDRRWSWGFGSFLAFQALSGAYLAATTAVAVPIALLTLVPGASRSGKELSALAAATALAAAVVFPFVYPYMETAHSNPMEWDLDSVQSVSAHPSTYLSSSSRVYRPLSRAWLRGNPNDDLFPGITLVLLGAMGTAVLLSRRGGFSRPWSKLSCYGALGVAGVVLSFGPKTPIYVFLHEHSVLVRGLGHVTRFGFLISMSLCVLSSFALAWLFEISVFNRRQKHVAAAIASFFIIESSTALPSIEPLRDRPPEVYSWLARQGQRGPIVELPYHPRQTRYLFWARHHDFLPSLGGASRFVPVSHRWIEVVMERFPSTDSLALLKKLDVRYVIIHLDAYTPQDLLRLLNGLARYPHALLPLRDFGTELVFELVSGEAAAPPSKGSEEAYGELLDVELVPDRGSDGRQPLRPHEAQFEVRLSLVSRVSGLRILYGPNPRVPAERIELWSLEDDGGGRLEWATPRDWPALVDLITSLIDNPREGAQELRFDPTEMVRFRIRLESSEGRPDVRAIEVLGSSSLKPAGPD